MNRKTRLSGVACVVGGALLTMASQGWGRAAAVRISPVTGSVFSVTNTNDDGPGSLRRAIEDANATPNRADARDRIVFDIPGEGVQSIPVYSALPEITEAVAIDGYTQPGASLNELDAEGPLNVLIELDGTRAGNADGIVVRPDSCTLRGLAVRGFAGDGIRIVDGSGNRIEGNIIGPSLVPGARAGNGRAGVSIQGASAVANAVLGNRIADNANAGIELAGHVALAAGVRGAGPNHQQNAPVLQGVTRLTDGDATGARIEGTLESAPDTRFRLEFYATRAPGRAKQGDKLLKVTDVTTDSTGRVGFVLVLPKGVESRALVTATATDADGNTSEFSAPVQAPAIVKSWNNAAGGNWNVDGNWLPTGVPAATDDVQITLAGTYTVTLNVSATVASLTLGVSPGNQTLSIAANVLTLSGASTVSPNGILSQSGGTITGAGSLTIDGAYNWTGGTMSGAATTAANGGISLGGGSDKFLNARTLNSPGTVTFVGTGRLFVGQAAVVNNSGTWDCQNDGSIASNTGGGTFNNSGTFKKSIGAVNSTVDVPFNNTATGTVLAQSGTIVLSSGGVHAGSFSGSPGTVRFSGGTHDLNAGTTFAGTIVEVAGATLNVNSALSAPTFTQSGGILQGPGTFTTTGLYTWTGGTMAGAATMAANGGISLGGTSDKFLNARTLNSPGTVTWVGTGRLFVGQAAIVNNSGTWDCQNDSSIAFNTGGGTFNNSGMFKKSIGAVTSTVGVTFNNTATGSVLAQSGTIVFSAGGVHAGSFSGSPGALQFSGGTHDLNAGTSFAGSIAEVSGATLNVNSAVAAQTFAQSGGILQGAGTFTMSGLYTWTGGTLAGAGTTAANGGIALGGSSDMFINARTLNSPGAVTWVGTGRLFVGQAAIVNNAGTWDCQSDSSIVFNTGGGTFNNSGTFKKTNGVAITTVGVPFSNTNTVQALAATLKFTAAYTQTAGSTTLNGGALTTTASLAIQGGSLTGAGTVTGPVVVSSSGALSPGLPPGQPAGTLNLVGNYSHATPAPNGSFNVELGGTAQGSGYDHAQITGTAALSGLLNVSLINGFSPSSSDSFTVMNYTSHTGAYTLNAPTGVCTEWLVDYRATSIVLKRAALPAELTGLTILPNKTDIAWAAAPDYPGTSYDLLRGELSTLPVGPGADESCLANAIAGTTSTDAAVPAPGHGFWYVVRERVTSCGIGTYGFASGPSERLSNACL